MLFLDPVTEVVENILMVLNFLDFLKELFLLLFNAHLPFLLFLLLFFLGFLFGLHFFVDCAVVGNFITDILDFLLAKNMVLHVLGEIRDRKLRLVVIEHSEPIGEDLSQLAILQILNM